MRTCKYRNCKKQISGRSNKLFCSTKCGRNEEKYKQRLKKKLNKNAKEINN